MIASLADLENIAVPVVGLCILITLAAAVCLEPQRDYSRKIYICMLCSCAAVLVTESIQWLIIQGFTGNASAFQWMDMFAFYAMIAILCFCWTLYSYFWFNGHPASGNALRGFVAAPVCEMAILIVNFFTGAVFTVDADGLYCRGSIFALYIGFSYLYLIAAILITAINAARKNGSARRQDYIAFLFCFLLPIIGPLGQYALPDLSLMGITEVIALLIIYVSVQQRTTAQYAVEQARRKDEYLAYEDTLEQILADSADAICVLRINFTQNMFIGGRGFAEKLLGNFKAKTVDGTIADFAAAIGDAGEAARFLEMANREKLLGLFADKKTSLSMTYHREVDSGERHLIRIILRMLQNPSTGDVEGILYSADIDHQDKEERVITSITDREYDSISLIDVGTGRIQYQYSGSKSDAAIRFGTGDYDEMMARVIADIHDPSEPGAERDRLSLRRVVELLRSMREYSYVCEYSSLSGEKLQKKVTFQYLDDRQTEILFLVSDITEETRQERERSAILEKALRDARHADAVKSEFLSNVSHDMRTPLNAILGYAGLAQTASELTEAKDYLARLAEAGNILLSLVNETLDLSKIETGEVNLSPTPTSCAEVLNKIVGVIKPAADDKGVRLVCDVSRAAGVTVLADVLRLQEIVTNLLANAVKFTPENGEVFFAVECVKLDERTVHDKLTIRDTGCGMRPEFLSKMYEPFAQERQLTDTAGSGLGLSIVKKLVDIMNGRIEVSSEVGAGTEFTLWLDFERTAAAPARPEAADAAAYCALSGRRILLAEDNLMNMEIARALLEAKQMHVVPAENGKTACELFEKSAPGEFDAILMDLRMPVMNGHDAARYIRKLDRADAASVPIIAMSADAFEDDVRSSLDAGMNMHISKPFSPAQLYKALAELTAAGA